MEEILSKFKPRDITVITTIITLLLCFAIYNNVFLAQYKKFINKENEKSELIKAFGNKSENLSVARKSLLKMKRDGRVAIKEYLKNYKFLRKEEIKISLEKVFSKLLTEDSFKIKIEMEKISPFYIGFEDEKRGDLPIIWKIPVSIVFNINYEEIFSLLNSLEEEEIIFNLGSINIEEKDSQLITNLDINVFTLVD